MNCSYRGLSMNTRFMRGAPKLPNVLYSPFTPVVKIEFINIWDRVSKDASWRSPKRESTVQTLMPLGISFFALPSFWSLFRCPRVVTLPSGVIWLYVSTCANMVIGATTSRNESISLIINHRLKSRRAHSTNLKAIAMRMIIVPMKWSE